MPRTYGNRKSGMFREIHGISMTMEPPDSEIYRSLLPAPLAMPTEPIISIYVASFDRAGGMPPFQWRPFLEGAIRLRCAYEGEEGWFFKTIPVTSRMSALTGRSLGFPKYIADTITLSIAPERSAGEVKHKSTVRLRVEFTPAPARELTLEEQRVLGEGGRFWDFYLSPFPYGRFSIWSPRIWRGIGDDEHAVLQPGERSVLLKISPREVVPSTWRILQTGTVQIAVNAGDPWASLIQPGRSAPAIVFHWEGGVVLDARRIH
jgi:hypothetical protein